MEKTGTRMTRKLSLVGCPNLPSLVRFLQEHTLNLTLRQGYIRLREVTSKLRLLTWVNSRLREVTSGYVRLRDTNGHQNAWFEEKCAKNCSSYNTQSSNLSEQPIYPQIPFCVKIPMRMMDDRIELKWKGCLLLPLLSLWYSPSFVKWK